MTGPEPLHLFQGYGIEIEYMIVDAETLDVRPIADELLRQVGGGDEIEVELGPLAWSNELALHVIELKTNGPSATLRGLGRTFHEHVRRVRELLEPFGAILLPTAMHPWMDPHAELRLWPHEHNTIYRTFNRIFDCRGHGWANLQSMHVNLPFANDREFGKLHAAIRLVLPLLPGLAASSPFVDGVRSEHADARLAAYASNARRVPSVTAEIVPEPVFTRRDYERGILERIYGDLAPLDPEGVLRNEWVNARGCIARFDRMAIEIRVLDVQECPSADIAIAGAVTSTVHALVEEAWAATKQQQKWHERELAVILRSAIRDGDETIIDDRQFLDAFGFPERGSARLGEVWQYLVESVVACEPDYAEWRAPLGVILEKGCLSRRIARAVGSSPTRNRLFEVYATLAGCLASDAVFVDS